LRKIAAPIVILARRAGGPDIASEIILILGDIMRNHILVLTTAILLGACADDQHTTAPASSRSARSAATGDVMPSTQGLGIPQARPLDPGFTQITTVKSALVNVPTGTSGSATATCPAGSQLISGGYVLNGYTGSFALDTNAPNGSNGWTVKGFLGAAGSFVTIVVTATCIQ
jgi:hypothetical protein